MKKLILVLAASSALALPSGAAASVGHDVRVCTGGQSFGQFLSSAQPGFNLGQHQKGGNAPGGGARAFAASVHCA